MAKSAINRHHAVRLVQKWTRAHKVGQCEFKLDSLSLSKVFKQDPWDNGYSDKNTVRALVKEGGKTRASLRRDEREALDELV